MRLSGVFNEPCRVQRAREESQYEVLESLRHFFAPVDYDEAVVKGEQEQTEQLRSSDGAPTTTAGTTTDTYVITTAPTLITTTPTS